MEKKFLGVTIGQWIGGMIHIVVLSYLIGVNHQILRSHSEAIKQHEEQLKMLQKDIVALDQNGPTVLKHYVNVIDSLSLRVNKTETAITKIEVLANDMDWLKRFLLATPEERKKILP
jgi:hypothetical protein